MPRNEVIAQVVELCTAEANAFGGNAFVNAEYTSFHGGDSSDIAVKELLTGSNGAARLAAH